MRLTGAESRALLFVGLLLLLALAARLRDSPVEVAGEAVALDLAAQVATVDSALESKARRSRPFEPGERLDPNTASEEDLNRLPGIGPALAARIVAERERGGPFRTVADLERVSGIGPSKLARISPFLEIVQR